MAPALHLHLEAGPAGVHRQHVYHHLFVSQKIQDLHGVRDGDLDDGGTIAEDSVEEVEEPVGVLRITEQGPEDAVHARADADGGMELGRAGRHGVLSNPDAMAPRWPPPPRRWGPSGVFGATGLSTGCARGHPELDRSLARGRSP